MLATLLKQVFRARPSPAAASGTPQGFRRLLTELDDYQADAFDAEDIMRMVLTRHGPMMYNRHDYIIGASLETYGEWCEQEIALLSRFVERGMTVCDVGAHIGTHTLFFSRAVGPAGRVHAFEPQPFVFHFLAGNVALNSLQNVRCRPVAAGAAAGTAVMPDVSYAGSRNFGAIALEQAGAGERVPVAAIDDLALGPVHLMKIDVEGMEKDVLDGAARTIAACRPVLYVENNRKAQSGPLIETLAGHGYEMYWHALAYYNPDNYAGSKDNLFGTAGETNMLCLPRGTAPSWLTLPRVTP